MMLKEPLQQVLYKIMQKLIVDQNLDEKRVKAADQFRLPYWDWARSPRLPEVCSLERVNIVTARTPDSEDVENFFAKIYQPQKIW